ncbi:hypothetical protein DMUE_5269 [Dictyocoela muelleri]|nr:hypothetical protein DMUE_5269 [Dictyocoela muelleri]
MRHQHILFFDESGFNLHTSNNYGFSMPNEDAIISVNSSRGGNISLCALFSISGIVDYVIVEGSFNSKKFVEFINGCINERSINPETTLIMDNAAIHHSQK